MKRNSIITGTFVTLLIVIVVSLIGWYVVKPAPILLQGEVEVKSVKISSKLTGRVDSLPVREGERVQKGQLLFVLSTPEIEAKLRQATAAREAADAQQAKADKGARSQEIDAAYSLWQKAQAGLELAEKTYNRVKNLYEEGVLPRQKLDEAEANYKAAQNTVTAARSQYQLAREGARNEDKEAGKALVAQASGAVSEVESYISDARQYAPFTGEVGTVIAEQGELISSGYPIITLLDLDDMWVTFNVKEDLLPRIKMGTVLDAYVPALDRHVKLTVDYLGAQADYATWSATRTRGDFDVRTFEIRARPDSPQDGLRPGMTVTVNWNEI